MGPPVAEALLGTDADDESGRDDRPGHVDDHGEEEARGRHVVGAQKVVSAPGLTGHGRGVGHVKHDPPGFGNAKGVRPGLAIEVEDRSGSIGIAVAHKQQLKGEEAAGDGEGAGIGKGRDEMVRPGHQVLKLRRRGGVVNGLSYLIPDPGLLRLVMQRRRVTIVPVDGLPVRSQEACQGH